MKFRFDFVTNSSSSCYTITLQIANTDGVTVSFKGDINAGNPADTQSTRNSETVILTNEFPVLLSVNKLHRYGPLNCCVCFTNTKRISSRVPRHKCLLSWPADSGSRRNAEDDIHSADLLTTGALSDRE